MIIALVPRQRSTREPRRRAEDAPTPDRLRAVERVIRDMKDSINLLFQRLAAIQAELDHIAARLDIR